MNYIQTIGHTVERLAVVDSTNNYAAKLISETNVLNGTVILAKNQTLGRGQKGNSWMVEPGKNLTISIILNQFSFKSDEQFFISQWISLSVVDLLNKYEINSKIKWPNDIVIENDKTKIAGILIENSLRGQSIKHSIVGLGLNVNQEHFAADINASSLSLLKGKEMNLDDVLDDLIYFLNVNYILLSNRKDELKTRYLSNLLGYKSKLNYRDVIGEFSATIDHILPDGRLVLLDEQKKERIYMFKEVSLNL